MKIADLQGQTPPSAGMPNTTDPTASESAKSHAANLKNEFCPSYLRLESRQLLSATFLTVGTSELVLDDFDVGQNLSFSQSTTDVNLTPQDSYIFRLASGSWTGDASNPLIEIENFAGGTNNQLEVATSYFNNSPSNAQLTIDGSTGSGSMVEFDQASARLEFGSLQLSNFANDNRGFILSADGDVTLENVTVFDSDPNDAAAEPASYNVNIDGDLQLQGDNGNLIDNVAAEITLISQDSIAMDGNATLQTTAGSVSITTTGSGDIALSSVTSGATGDAVSIFAGGDVLDVRATPGNNIAATAGQIEIVANGGIGGPTGNAIEVSSLGLQFTSQNAAHFESTDKITVVGGSTSFGGSIVAGEIDILADITTSDSFDFQTTASVGSGDLRVDNNAAIRLSSGIDSVIRIEAVNNITIAEGQILTSGSDQHTVSILSTGPEGNLSNLIGTLPSIVTNHLDIDVGAGIATPETPLRTDVDRLTARVRESGDLFLAEANDISLERLSTVDGAIDVVADGTIVAAHVSANEAEAVEDNSDILSLRSTSANVLLGQVFAADGLNIQAATTIQQLADGWTISEADANFAATDAIQLAASPSESLAIQGHARFTANTIEVGLDGSEAGDTAANNVNLGSTELNASQAILIEDDSTRLAGDSNVDEIHIESGGDLTNADNSTLTATHGQFTSPGNIVLGAANNDQITLGSVGLVSSNVHLEVESDLVVNGRKAGSPGSVAIGQPLVQRTQVDQTLYIIAQGSVEQSVGELCAKQIGIVATEHVHLSSISSTNEALAVSAGASNAVSDTTINATLQTLEAVPNSDVDSNRPQAIAVSHRGIANIQTVASPHNGDAISGLNSTEGSITAFADQAIEIRQDISATSGILDPQITLWSAAGNSDNPAIEFLGGQTQVNGPTNFGTVNSNQVFLNLFDDDGFVFEGTTKILTLSPDGTADQDIIIEYGHPGEAGYRVGVVWDALNNPNAPLENINLFVSSPDLDSEAYNDPIYQNNIVTRHPIGGNEGGRETFSKIQPFSKEAIIAHTDQPNVFADIIVRNDQHINLFSGDLRSVDNLLNESEQRLLLAELDAPKKATPILPTINEVDPLIVKQVDAPPFDSPTPLEQTTSLFGREIAPFEKGELQWVQVAIPLDELEMADDEVQLKFPVRFYPASEAAEEHGFENVGDNETDRIVKQIESSPDAEPGYWYRIFKAYDNRDDELFFYYFKTGQTEPDNSDSAAPPETQDQVLEDFPTLDSPSTLDSPPTDSLPDAPKTPTETLGYNTDDSNDDDSYDQDATHSSMLLLALMGFKSTKTKLKSHPHDAAIMGDTKDSPKKFDRQSRLLRKLRSVS